VSYLVAVDLPRILCVDDEPAILKGMQAILRRYFQVSTAADATAALALMAEQLPFRWFSRTRTCRE